MTLLEKYDTLENILAHTGELSPKVQLLIGDGSAARHSQFLARIRTDVPFDIDAKNFRRETSDILYTPALIEFLKTYEFRSLLPNEIVHTVVPYQLPQPPQAISDGGKIWARIAHDEPYALFTSGHPIMTELSISFSEEEVYMIDLQTQSAQNFVQNILHEPHVMTTYNWKEHARSMLWWLKYRG